MSEKLPVSSGLNENIDYITGLFQGDITIKVRRFSNISDSSVKVCVMFIDGLTNEKFISEMRRRVKSVNIDGIFDAQYIEEIIKDGKYSPLKTIGSTQRPDIAAAKLLEGRIALVVNSSPVVLTAPFVFLEYFESGDDYYNDAYYASFNRILRLIGFFFTISLPLYRTDYTSYPDASNSLSDRRRKPPGNAIFLVNGNADLNLYL